MKIVLAPDSFKGNLTSLEVAAALEKGVKRVLPKAKCIKVPMADGGNEVVRHAYNYYNLALSISLAKIAGQAFRIGHLGDINELMLLTPINGAEMAMKDLGYPIELGSGVAAAQEYLRSIAKPRIQQ